MQQSRGEYRFNSIDDFRNGLAGRIFYNNAAGTNDPNDIAASFSFATTTFYLQDDWYVNDDLTLLFGLRYDRWSSDDRPRYNEAFETEYADYNNGQGLTNTGNLDGIDLWQPRVGFNYVLTDDMELHGGFGLYSGGNPNVWVSNAYSNDGVIQVATTVAPWQQDVDFGGLPVDLFNTPLVNGASPGYGIPQALYD